MIAGKGTVKRTVNRTEKQMEKQMEKRTQKRTEKRTEKRIEKRTVKAGFMKNIGWYIWIAVGVFCIWIALGSGIAGGSFVADSFANQGDPAPDRQFDAYDRYVSHGDNVDHAYSDLLWLVEVMDQVTADKLSLTALKYGTLHYGETYGEEMALLWSARFPSLTCEFTDRELLCLARPATDTTLSMTVQKHGEEQAMMMVSIQTIGMEASFAETLEQYERWFRDIADIGNELGWQADCRLNVQSTSAEQDIPKRLWSSLERAGAERVSQDAGYKDERSESRTFRAEHLHQSVTVGGERIHLQGAWHRSTEDNHYRVTLGTPLVTIEY